MIKAIYINSNSEDYSVRLAHEIESKFSSSEFKIHVHLIPRPIRIDIHRKSCMGIACENILSIYFITDIEPRFLKTYKEEIIGVGYPDYMKTYFCYSVPVITSDEIINCIKYCYKSKGESAMPPKYWTRFEDVKFFADIKDFKNPDIKIKKVIFNGPATIVFWKDNTKTIVKRMDSDYYDPEKAILMAFYRKVTGLNKSQTKKSLDKFTKYVCDQPTEKIEVTNIEDPGHPTETVYGYVPVELVDKLIKKHGGLKWL